MTLERLGSIAQSKRLRAWLAAILLVVTVTVFVRFFRQNPAYIHELRHVSPGIVAIIMLLNAGTLLSLVVVYHFSLQLCGKEMPFKQLFMLAAYSSISNFFGPLQGGVGVRAVYLKTKLQVRARDYVAATMVYYALFSLISATFLFGGSLRWWQAVPGVTLVAIVCYGTIRFFARSRSDEKPPRLMLQQNILVGLFLATLAQVCFVAAYYGVELHAVHAQASLSQVITYTGAANFAVFVALTPDAIGIRESFLALSQRLHHVSSGDILSANLLDRASYALFLVVLFVVILAMHAKRRLGIKSDVETEPVV